MQVCGSYNPLWGLVQVEPADAFASPSLPQLPWDFFNFFENYIRNMSISYPFILANSHSYEAEQLPQRIPPPNGPYTNALDHNWGGS